MSDKYGNMRNGAERLQRRSLNQISRVSAEAQAGRADVVRWMMLGELVALDEIQVRAGGLVEETVERYAVVMYESQGWGDFPPIDIHFDRQYGWLISEGFHRHAAAVLASQWLIGHGLPPIDQVQVIERPEGFEAALEHAEEANLKNSEKLTRDDLKNILWRRLERGHAWGQMSDRAIARELGVTHPTIGAWKTEFYQGTGKNLPVREKRGKKIVTEDGKTMDVSGIKKANRRRAKKPLTTTQRRRRVVKALHEAAGHLRALDSQDAASIERYAEELAEEWGL